MTVLPGKLKGGFTTGTAAAAAAKAAAMLMEGQTPPAVIAVQLPGGNVLNIPVQSVFLQTGIAKAVVVKDAGDDPDITHGKEIIVILEEIIDGPDIVWQAGEGVGTVTLPGLRIPPGEPAINPGPRAQILANVRSVTKKGMRITISIPGGVELAKTTFNPRLGIIGGLSILGTTGIVRPFSASARRESLLALLSVTWERGCKNPILVPGNYGRRAAITFLGREADIIEVGNDWGVALQWLSQRGCRQISIVGHGGKLAKLARGDWDTHSRRGRQAQGFIRYLSKSQARGTTVDAVTTSLPPRRQNLLCNKLAHLIQTRIRHRFHLNARIAICDMHGAILGKTILIRNAETPAAKCQSGV